MAPEKLSTSESSSGKLVEVTGWDHHKTIFVTCLFVISAIVLKILYHRCRYIAKFIPESCGTSAAVARLKPTFTIDIFFAVLLPPIMLESAYSLNQKHFYLNIIPVLLYAVIGTVLNIATIGPSLYVVELLGAKKWLHIPHISLLELTIFGATLSAIDPVSVALTIN
ncbi:hypothetical protein TYRP_004815 [Tyrophagus putrescentiae]|nr:hypothetical protein TYRP_004815 [Tyrophagus putrescentiae]